MSGLKVVLLGAAGQLGRTLAGDWQSQNPLHCFSRSELDLCQPARLSEKLSAVEPRVIVNAAAYTQVDKAESESGQALAVNRDGAAAVAQWAADHDCRLIHLSTDFVFDGRSTRPYTPEDSTAPVNHYGFSKREGENAILEIHPRGSVIIRTSWLYSRYRPNFVTTMLGLMKQRDQLSVVADQIGSPTSTHSLVRLIECIIRSDETDGIFHWSDAGVASWYDFAVAIQEEALAAGLLPSAVAIKPVQSAEYPTAAVRPEFSVLDKSACYQHFALPAVHWRTELRRVIEEIGETGKSGTSGKSGQTGEVGESQ